MAYEVLRRGKVCIVGNDGRMRLKSEVEAASVKEVKKGPTKENKTVEVKKKSPLRAVKKETGANDTTTS